MKTPNESEQIILYLIFFLLIALYFAFRNQTKEILIWATHKVQFTEEPIVRQVQLKNSVTDDVSYIFLLLTIYFAFMNQTKEILLWATHKVQFTKNLLLTSPIEEFNYQCCNFQLLALYIPHLQILTLLHFCKTYLLLFPQQRAGLSPS
jgi:cbb3-type cytochrome oxidase subunit 3